MNSLNYSKKIRIILSGIFVTVAFMSLSLFSPVFSIFSFVPFVAQGQVIPSVQHGSTATFYIFTKSLRLGMTDQDVTALQKILNQDPDTQVAASGLGSKDQETAYFGHLTQLAVIKFQNKYSQDILVPAGLLAGNGFVGPLTIKKLNIISKNNFVSSQNSGQTSQNNQNTSKTLASSQKTAKIYAVSPYQIQPGGTFTIYGTGFAATNNIVSIGSTVISGLNSTNSGQIISVQISTLIQTGTYPITVSANNIQATYPTSHPVSVIITQNPAQVPTITSVSPTSVSQNDTITITGTNFTAHSSIYTPLGSITGLVSSDGKTLTFQASELSKISYVSTIKQSAAAATVGIYVPVTVVTEGGPSQTPGYFILK